MPGASRISEGEVADQLQSTFRTGAGQLVAAPGAGFKIAVFGFAIVASAAATVKFQSAANDKSALWSLGTNGGMFAPPSEFLLFETNENEALNLVASAGADVQVWYVKVRT